MKKLWERIIEFSKANMFNTLRRGVISTIILVAVIYSLIYGLVEVTSLPGFCNIACHEMKPMYKTWKASVHSEVRCDACHVHPGFQAKVMHKLVTMKELYRHITNTYEQPIRAKEQAPVKEACMRCHSTRRTFTATGDLRIPHEKHRGKKGAPDECITCHARVVHGQAAVFDKDGNLIEKAKTSPPMELCLEKCHDGKKAPDRCDACHTKKQIPDTHQQADWLETHGQQSKTTDCVKCHAWRPDFCNDCHTAKPDTHLGNWRTNHRKRFLADEKPGCEACHTNEFCIRCHGIAPYDLGNVGRVVTPKQRQKQ